MYGIMSPERRKIVYKHFAQIDALDKLWELFPDDSELMAASKKARQRIAQDSEESYKRERERQKNEQ